MVPEANFRNLFRTETETLAYAAQCFNVALTVVAEGKTLAEADLTGVETMADESVNKRNCRQLCELASEVKHDDLTHSEVLESFHLLMKSLEKRWSSLRLQYLAGMRIKRDQRGRGIDQQRSLDDGMDDCLMAQVKTVEYSQRKHGWPAD